LAIINAYNVKNILSNIVKNIFTVLANVDYIIGEKQKENKMDKEQLESKIDQLISMNILEIDELVNSIILTANKSYNKIYQDRHNMYDKQYKCKGKVNDPCEYCGEPSRLWDHVPPLIILANTNYDGRCIKVRSCYRCNSTLKDLKYVSIIERKNYLKGMYSKQFEILKRRLDHLNKLNNWF
jgi:hypothetical protein